MPGGRCAGCGRQGPSRKIAAHTLNCGPFQALYAADPAKALSPADEQDRWEREDKACGHEARKGRIAAAVRVSLERRTAQSARFARLPDILED